MHLRGAIELYRLAMTEDARHDRLHRPRLADVLSFDFATESEANAYIITTSSTRFTCASLLWLDTVGSITQGIEPKLLSFHDVDLDSSSTIQLGEIMGCCNGIMVQIARITALYARKKMKQGLIQDEDTYLNEEVADIRTKIELEQTTKAITNQAPDQLGESSPDKISTITSFFSCAARIYLHLVTTGFENLESLDHIVSPALEHLETKVGNDLLPTLVCPLFFLGCGLSNEDGFELLRKVFASRSILHPLFAHRTKLLPALEVIWKQSRGPVFSWNDVVDLTCDILLI